MEPPPVDLNALILMLQKFRDVNDSVVSADNIVDMVRESCFRCSDSGFQADIEIVTPTVK